MCPLRQNIDENIEANIKQRNIGLGLQIQMPKYIQTTKSRNITNLQTRSPAVAEGPRDASVPVEMSMLMSTVDLYPIAHNREAPNALCTLVEREKKSFQVTTKTSTERVGSRG